MITPDALSALRALGHEHRLAAFRALVQAGPPGLAVGELRARLDLAPATLTAHLNVLRAAGLVVDERDSLALAFVNRSRPAEDPGNLEAREVGIAVMALVDVHGEHRLAPAFVGQAAELAVAAVFAIAVGQLPAPECPVGHTHLPVLSRGATRRHCSRLARPTGVPPAEARIADLQWPAQLLPGAA